MKLFRNKVTALFAAIMLVAAGVTGLTGCEFGTGSGVTKEEPGAVKNLKAKAGNTEVTLRWTNPGAEGLTEVKVFLGEELKKTLVNKETSWTVTGLTNDTEYTFKVTAVFESGESFDATVKATPKETPQYTSVEFAENLVIGWNLGNTLDATASWTSDTETAWGMPKTTKAMIEGVHAAGFETIRIPVSWHNHVSGTDNKIDSTWMNRVKTIVDWAIDDGMYVIINIHHDNLTESEIASTPGFCLSTDSAIQTKSIKYVSDVWTQIATTFKDYDEHLVFEILNEPRCVGTDMEWGWYSSSDSATAKKYSDIITSYEQAGLDKIRSIPENADRFVMVPGYAASGTNQITLKAYTLPVDSADDKLLLSTHAYSPYNFALNGDMTKTDFLDTYKSELDSIFNYLKTNYVNKGIGVVMGEASATDKGNTDERIKWAKYYFGKAKECSIPVILWDNMVVYPNGDDGAERHGHFNRNTLSWYQPELIEAMVTAAGGKTGGSGTGGSSGGGSENPVEPFKAVTLFDAENFTAPDGMTIETVNGKKYLKMTINGYSTSFSIPAVDCNGASTFKVECFAEEAASGIKVIIGIKDSDWKDVSGPEMSPLVNSETVLTGSLSTGTDASTTKLVSKIQPMAQETVSPWGGANGVVFYISKIIAE